MTINDFCYTELASRPLHVQIYLLEAKPEYVSLSLQFETFNTEVYYINRASVLHWKPPKFPFETGVLMNTPTESFVNGKHIFNQPHLRGWTVKEKF